MIWLIQKNASYTVHLELKLSELGFLYRLNNKYDFKIVNVSLINFICWTFKKKTVIRVSSYLFQAQTDNLLRKHF